MLTSLFCFVPPKRRQKHYKGEISLKFGEVVHFSSFLMYPIEKSSVIIMLCCPLTQSTLYLSPFATRLRKPCMRRKNSHPYVGFSSAAESSVLREKTSIAALGSILLLLERCPENAALLLQLQPDRRTPCSVS